MIESTWNHTRIVWDWNAHGTREERTRARGIRERYIYTYTYVNAHSWNWYDWKEAERRGGGEEEKNIRKKYLPLKNHFTSPSGIFVRPHDKTIDLFSMASTVSAAIVAGLVLNSSSSIASVLFRVFVYFFSTKPPETEERRRTKAKKERKREKCLMKRVKKKGKDTQWPTGWMKFKNQITKVKYIWMGSISA